MSALVRDNFIKQTVYNEQLGGLKIFMLYHSCHRSTWQLIRVGKIVQLITSIKIEWKNPVGDSKVIMFFGW